MNGVIGEMIGMRERRGVGVVVVCSGDSITHKRVVSMICVVHFGDTRNDLTPASIKWLPNVHTEEQITTTTEGGEFVRKDTHIML